MKDRAFWTAVIVALTVLLLSAQYDNEREHDLAKYRVKACMDIIDEQIRAGCIAGVR